MSVKKRRLKRSIVNGVKEFVRDIVVSVLLIFVLTRLVIRPVVVSGHSMDPTLSDGSYGVTNILGRKLFGFERFDIVIVHLEQKDEYIVKRVVGLPGETISYVDGVLYVDGEAIAEAFLDTDYVNNYNGTFMVDISEFTLGEDEYYCLGDNRPHSSDSRVYGAFTSEQIISKGIFIIFPFSQMGVETW